MKWQTTTPPPSVCPETPWLVGLPPLAVTLGEPIRLCAPVDATLYENIIKVMEVWRGWYPTLSVIRLEAERITQTAAEPRGRHASFFSGGVDSFFTVLRHEGRSSAGHDSPLEELLTVWGFDVPLSNPEAFGRMRLTLQEAARALGKTLIDVATNLRTTRWRQVPFGPLAYGCALAAVAHVLGERYRSVRIAGGSYGHLGSHPLTDPLLSSSRLTIIHDSPEYSRVEKTALVSASPIAMRALHVCYALGSEKNCGRCDKCYRTMLTLDLLGKLQECATFSRENYTVWRASRLVLGRRSRLFFMEIREFAARRGRLDIVSAIDLALTRSERLEQPLAFVRRLRAVKYISRVAAILERCLLRESLCHTPSHQDALRG